MTNLNWGQTKPGEWQSEGYGFVIKKLELEPLHMRYMASFGNTVFNYFSTLEEAKDWSEKYLKVWEEGLHNG